jgi:predicted GNAT family acetyltransferase
MTVTVRDNRQSHRFELEIDDQVAKAWYREQGNVVTFTRTDVPDALSGKGVGSALAKGALDAVRAAGQKVVALCPFIASYIKRHREYEDLLAEPEKTDNPPTPR